MKSKRWFRILSLALTGSSPTLRDYSQSLSFPVYQLEIIIRLIGTPKRLNENTFVF